MTAKLQRLYACRPVRANAGCKRGYALAAYLLQRTTRNQLLRRARLQVVPKCGGRALGLRAGNSFAPSGGPLPVRAVFLGSSHKHRSVTYTTVYTNLCLAEVAVARQDGSVPIEFAADPGSYRHWRLDIDGAIATLDDAIGAAKQIMKLRIEN